MTAILAESARHYGEDAMIRLRLHHFGACFSHRPMRGGTALSSEDMFGKLKDWRRIHTRCDRCAHTFMSATAIAAIVIFWI